MSHQSAQAIYHFHDHEKGEFVKSSSIRISATTTDIEISGVAQDPYLVVYGDGSYNEYSQADLAISPTDFLEALLKVRLGESVSLGKERPYLSLGRNSIRLVHSSPGPDIWGQVPDNRSALLLLDAHELVATGPQIARTGLQLPEPVIQRELLNALRYNPTLIDNIGSHGFEGAVRGLLAEAHQSSLRFERIDEQDHLWIVHTSDETHGAMLLSVIPGQGGNIDVGIVDRINGIRDRRSNSKAVIVTQSYFSSDVMRSYGGLSRMELVDYDRLIGMVTDAGWHSFEPGMMTCPVAERPTHSVFISYSHTTRSFAVWLYNRLHGWGYDCFLDDVSLTPGEIILSALQQAISGTDTVLLCCSEEALKSEWVQKEVKCALKKEQKEERTILIPLDMDGSLEKTEDEIFAQLRNRLNVNFRQWDDRNKSGEALNKVRKAIALTAIS